MNLLPCPNPECGAECDVEVYSESHDGVPSLYRAGCNGGPCGYSGPHATSAERAAELHNSMPREEPWIPVTERLPAEWMVVDGWSVHGLHIRDVEYFGEGAFHSDKHGAVQLTHWRPYREPRRP